MLEEKHREYYCLHYPIYKCNLKKKEKGGGGVRNCYNMSSYEKPMSLVKCSNIYFKTRLIYMSEKGIS